jgi:K+-sensing histidine kinase KdpD
LKLALVPLNLKTLISAAIRDVTDKKKAESEIAAQNKKATTSKQRIRTVYLFSSSHDLQEPLRTLIIFFRSYKRGVYRQA